MRRMRTMFVAILVLLMTMVVVDQSTEAGIFFRQGRGLFPNAVGVQGRVQSRQSARQGRRSTRQSYGYGFRRCANCNRTRATATWET